MAYELIANRRFGKLPAFPLAFQYLAEVKACLTQGAVNGEKQMTTSIAGNYSAPKRDKRTDDPQ